MKGEGEQWRSSRSMAPPVVVVLVFFGLERVSRMGRSSAEPWWWFTGRSPWKEAPKNLHPTVPDTGSEETVIKYDREGTWLGHEFFSNFMGYEIF